MSDVLTLTEQLIRCPSVTPDDAGCMDIIVQRLQPYGFQAHWLDFGDTRNLWLRRGSQTPLFAFLGHTDVVPPGPQSEWQSGPFEPEIRNGFLYGRGAADMKSGVAAAVVAFERFVQAQPDHAGSIALLLTSDEEGLATHGIVKAVEALQARNEIIDWCLVGEPSSSEQLGDVIKIGRRGSLCARLQVLGTQGHVAYPHLADNPIHRLLPALTELSQVVWDQGNEFFPATSLQISNFNSGTGAENIIPGTVEVQFNLRFSTESNEAGIKQRVHEILDRHAVDYRLDWRLSGQPFLTRERELIDVCRLALKAVSGREPELSTGGGTSDGRFVAPTGAQVVELGPLNATIHKIDECVRVDDIEQLAAVYQRILTELCLSV